MIEESLVEAYDISKPSNEWTMHSGATERGGDILNDPNGYCYVRKRKGKYLYIYIYI